MSLTFRVAIMQSQVKEKHGNIKLQLELDGACRV